MCCEIFSMVFVFIKSNSFFSAVNDGLEHSFAGMKKKKKKPVSVFSLFGLLSFFIL